ncbi:guanylate cyclase [Chloropicon primus]|uniref:guanylate cyclase n=2 Tax=Chloropicon primus TaxID=1764295 RepID=A0A5B8MTV1_9CHLO|nr:guanylate cyclase [Chloropicon primus]|eukprot:QDZ23184.1 guanylate cyclase [Chloropicon primus]
MRGVALVLVLLMLLGGCAGASNKTTITFGQSCALTGPARALGQGMRNGILAAFKEAGEVGGRELELISYDDGYEPGPALANTRRLIEDDQVFALIGEVGTPTSASVLPLVEDYGVPFLAPFTGAMFLRQPWKEDVVNVRGSYNDETAAMIEYFVKKQKKARISIFYQNDSFGGAGLAGVQQALDGVSLKLYSEGTYERNSDSIQGGFDAVFSKPIPPEAVVMIGTYTQLAKFVNETKEMYPDDDISFSTVSFVGADAFSEALGSANSREGVVVSQVVPLPTDRSLDLTRRFQSALKALDPALNPGFVEYEGYMAGRLAVTSLQKMDEDSLMRDDVGAFLETIYDGVVDIGAGEGEDSFRLGPYGGNCSQISTGCQCNQGMREIWLTDMNAQSGEYQLLDFNFQFGTCGYEAPKPEVLSFGQSAVLSGEGKALGEGIQSGIRAAFQEANLAGGVGGFLLEVISYDDQNQPELAVDNTLKLLEEDRVVGLIGWVGTNTSLAVLPLLGGKIPLIAPRTSSMKLRDCAENCENVINIEPSSDDEVYALYHLFSTEYSKKTSFVFCSRDFQSIQLDGAWASVDLSAAPASGVTDADVAKVQGSEALIIACPVEQTINVLGSAPGIQFVGVPLLSEEELGLLNGTGQVVTTSPVPALNRSTGDDSLLVKGFQFALKSYDPGMIPSEASFLGYIQGQFVVQVLSSAYLNEGRPQGIEEGRENFISTVYAQEYFNIDGLQLGPYLDGPGYCNSGASNLWLRTDSEELEKFSWTTCGVQPELAAEGNGAFQDKRQLGGIIGGILGAVLLLSILGGFVVWSRLKKTKEDALMSTWKINFEDLEFHRLLGSGASGQTFQGTYKGANVVIKQIDREERKWADGSRNSRTGSSGKSNRSSGATVLQHEIQMLFKLRHPNIRLFMGAFIGLEKKRTRTWGSMSSLSARSKSREVNGSAHGSTGSFPSMHTEDSLLGEHPLDSIYIVSEYMSRGTLWDTLMNPTVILDQVQQVTFLHEVAKGMAFLHNQKPPIIHADIKSKNMLLDDRWTVKVGDFGHSLILDAMGESNRIGTPYWCAPEVLVGEPNTTKSDIYSFGILMWETFSRTDVYDGFDEESVLDGIKDGSLRPPLPGSCPAPMQVLMEKCWSQNPEDRPDFGSILGQLQTWLDQNPKSRSGGGALHRSVQLVNKMLPEHVALALQEGRPVEPEHFEDVSILFSDIVGYTTISSAFAPKEVMSMLDRLYSAFDALTRRHNLFKVETIGDAYMVVGGVPAAQSDHAARVCRMALEMVEVAGTIQVSTLDESFGYINIRLGIHSGPVVASVVGDLNPRYTLFGDSVNVASRMESTSQSGMIQISSQTKKRLEIQDPALQTQYRGEANVKGKGIMRTYWLRPPGHILLLNWMSSLMAAGSKLEDLQDIPSTFVQQAETEKDLAAVARLKPEVRELSEQVLQSNDEISLQDILALGALLEKVEKKEHLEGLIECGLPLALVEELMMSEPQCVQLDEILRIGQLEHISRRIFTSDAFYQIAKHDNELLVMLEELKADIGSVERFPTRLGRHVESIEDARLVVELEETQIPLLLDEVVSTKSSPSSVIDAKCDYFAMIRGISREILDEVDTEDELLKLLALHDESDERFSRFFADILQSKTLQDVLDRPRAMLLSWKKVSLSVPHQDPLHLFDMLAELLASRPEEEMIAFVDVAVAVEEKHLIWMSELCGDNLASVEELLLLPRSLLFEALGSTTRENLQRLLEIRKTQCLPWIAELVEEGGGNDGSAEDGDAGSPPYSLSKILDIPRRLLLSFTKKEDLKWALSLSEYSHTKHSGHQGNEDPIKRAHTNSWINQGHVSTLGVLQNAALKKMLLKKDQLQEELKSIEAKIQDETTTASSLTGQLSSM